MRHILHVFGLFSMLVGSGYAQALQSPTDSDVTRPDTGGASEKTESVGSGERSAIDRFYGNATLVEDPSNSTIQKFAFSGRLQLDTYKVDADQGKADGWEIRRLRMGFKGDAFSNWSFRFEGDFNTSGDDFFKRTTDSWVSYQTSTGLALTVGKQSAAFTLDGHTSSNNLYTTERSILGNNVWFPGEYFTGAAVEKTTHGWSTCLGIFSSGSENQWFGNCDGSGFVLGSLGYDFADRHQLDTGELTADLVYQDLDENNDATLPNEWVGSLSLELKQDRWGFEGNFSATRGYPGQGDLVGFTIMPLFDLTDSIQFALRYSYLDSNKPEGIRLGRYGNQVVEGRGDHYQDLYAGVNGYIDGHRLKVQLGLQWAEMEDSTDSGGDYSGFSWTLALRTNW